MNQIAEPCDGENTISPKADAVTAPALLNRTGASRLLVVDKKRLLGILSLKDLLRFLATKVQLEGDEEMTRLVPDLGAR